MGEPAPKHYYSIEEYLEIEKNSLEKIEYYDGEIFAMSGGSINHSLLAGNTIIALGNSIRKKGKTCRTFTSDAKIAVSDRKFLYADASVVCGKTETYATMKEGIKNPILIVEVLSDSTALYDREIKFQAYQSIDSFQEYILVSQEKMFVEVYYKAIGANFWQYSI
jgi:Uma2 family endonuclease